MIIFMSVIIIHVAGREKNPLFVEQFSSLVSKEEHVVVVRYELKLKFPKKIFIWQEIIYVLDLIDEPCNKNKQSNY